MVDNTRACHQVDPASVLQSTEDRLTNIPVLDHIAELPFFAFRPIETQGKRGRALARVTLADHHIHYGLNVAFDVRPDFQ